MPAVQSATAELGNGRSLHAVIGGAGADIVLIHGALATHQDWLSGPFARIAELGRTLAIDRPGHGSSPRQRLDLSIREQAGQLQQGLATFGVQQAVVVAHSFGARLALALAERQPDMVVHLVLVAPAAFREFRLLEHSLIAPRAAPLFGPPLSASVPALFDRTWIEAIHRLMFAPGEPAPEWRARYPWEAILDRSRMTAEGEDFAELHPLSGLPDIDLSAVQVPVTIIAGMADLIVDPLSQSERLAKMMGARFLPVAGHGHMVHHSSPEIVIKAVAEALAHRQPGGADAMKTTRSSGQ